MTPHDKPEFERLLGELFAAYRQPPAQTDVIEGFWKSLVRLSIIEFNRVQALMLAELEFTDPPKYLSPRHIWAANTRLRARGGDTSARPTRSVHQTLLELADRDPQHQGHIRPALSLNEQVWREFGDRDPELQALEYGIAQCGLILARDAPGSPQYAEAVREDRKFRDERQWLIERRRAEAEKREAA